MIASMTASRGRRLGVGDSELTPSYNDRDRLVVRRLQHWRQRRRHHHRPSSLLIGQSGHVASTTSRLLLRLGSLVLLAIESRRWVFMQRQSETKRKVPRPARSLTALLGLTTSVFPIEDDRGVVVKDPVQPVSVLSPQEFQSLERWKGATYPRWWRQHELRPVGLCLWGLRWIVMMAGLLWIVSIVANPAISRTLWSFAFPAVCVGVVLLYSQLAFMRFVVGPFETWKQTEGLVAHGRCAGCGCRLDGLQTESDGCTICPECAAAWRLPLENARRGAVGGPPNRESAPMSRKGWIWIILGVVVVVASMVAMALGIHWLAIAAISITVIAPIAVIGGWVAAISFIQRLIWPRGVLDSDHRDQATFLQDSKDFGLAKAERTRARIAASQLGRLALFTGRGLIAFLSWCLPPLVFGAFDPPPVLEWSIGGVWWLFAMVVIVRHMKVQGIRWESRGLIAIGCCPSCGYDLLKLPVEDDGCRVCPECGAAWRLPSDDRPRDAGEATV